MYRRGVWPYVQPIPLNIAALINADYTVTLARLPEGPALGMASHSHYSSAGVATGSATLFDHHGPVGSCVSVALAHSGFLASPP